MNIHLIIQPIRHPDKKRDDEYQQCITKNLENKDINYIHFLIEDCNSDYHTDYNNKKIVTHNLGHWMTYYDAIKYGEEKIPKGDTVILANLDIYFEDLSKLHTMRDDDFLCLTRYEKSYNGELKLFVVGNPERTNFYYPRCDSNDVWIWKNGYLNKSENMENICIGRLQCEQKFLAQVHINNPNLNILNPCLDIVSIHNHKSCIRGRERRIVAKGPNLFSPINDRISDRNLYLKENIPILNYLNNYPEIYSNTYLDIVDGSTVEMEFNNFLVSGIAIKGKSALMSLKRGIKKLDIHINDSFKMSQEEIPLILGPYKIRFDQPTTINKLKLIFDLYKKEDSVQIGFFI
jgi:hypothetical protein